MQHSLPLPRTQRAEDERTESANNVADKRAADEEEQRSALERASGAKKESTGSSAVSLGGAVLPRVSSPSNSRKSARGSSKQEVLRALSVRSGSSKQGVPRALSTHMRIPSLSLEGHKS